MSTERIIISLGGSLMVPNTIDTDFITRFKNLIINHVEAGKSFVIITGGGKVCREYQAQAMELNPKHTTDDLDWVGIYVTRLNGMLLRVAFGDKADSHIVTDPGTFPQTTKPIVIGAGWKPGWSTDYDAVMIAEKISSHTIINLTNIDYVYDGDPKKDSTAKPQEHLTWKQYRGIIPAEWSPGLNTPFDPIASKKAEEFGIEVAIIGGQDLDRLDKYLSGKSFIGTRITV